MTSSQPHSQGGVTGQLNGQPLCARHNAIKGTLPAEQLPPFDQPGRTTHHPHGHNGSGQSDGKRSNRDNRTSDSGPDPPDTS